MQQDIQQIRDYIVARLKQGVREDLVVQELEAAGWPTQDVGIALDQARAVVTAHAPIQAAQKKRVILIGLIVTFVSVTGLIVGNIVATTESTPQQYMQESAITTSLRQADYVEQRLSPSIQFLVFREWRENGETLALDSIGTYSQAYYNYDETRIKDELIGLNALSEAQSLSASKTKTFATYPGNIERLYEIQVVVNNVKGDVPAGLEQYVRQHFEDDTRTIKDLVQYTVDGRTVADFIVDNADDTLLDQRKIVMLSNDQSRQLEVIVNRSASPMPIDKNNIEGLYELIGSIIF